MNNKNTKMTYLSFFMIIGLLLTPNLTKAAIFKCVNKQGAVYYNDKPCPKNNKETKLKAVKDPKNGYISKPFVEKTEKVKSVKGIVVGNDETKEKESKNDAKKRDNENLAGDVITNKSDASNNNTIDSSVDSSTTSNNKGDSNIPSVEEEIKKVLGNSLGSKESRERKFLSRMVN